MKKGGAAGEENLDVLKLKKNQTEITATPAAKLRI